MPLSVDPAWVTFTPSNEMPDEGHNFESAGGAWAACMEPSHWGPWMNEIFHGEGLDERYMRLWSRFEITDDQTAEAEVIEDAYWSDGEQVTAVDAASMILLHAQKPHGDDDSSTDLLNAISDIQFPDGRDGLRLTIKSQAGAIGNFLRGEVWNHLGRRENAFQAPAHIEPYTSIVDTCIDQLPEWTDRTEDTDSLMNTDELRSEYFGQDTMQKFSDPENVVTHGAWTPTEIQGSTAIILEPNEHWRNADGVNFDQITYTYLPGQQRYQAELQANRLDYGQIQLTQGSAEALPDTYEPVQRPGPGRALGLDLSHKHLGKRDVRAAMMYALDNETIAGNINPTTTRPIDVPGYDDWRPNDVAEDSWYEENLIDYSQDTDRATTLMENAGFSMEDGTWVHDDGTEMSFGLATPSGSPIWEETVADQLSDFGIQTQVQTKGAATYSEELYNGQLDMWRFLGAVPGGTYAINEQKLWKELLTHRPAFLYRNWYHPNATSNTTETWEAAIQDWEDTGTVWAGTNWDLFDDLYVNVPPIGEPDGDPTAVEWRPTYLQLRLESGQGEVTNRHKKLGVWTANYNLMNIPTNMQYSMNYFDMDHFNWPTDTPAWEWFDIALPAHRMLSMNMVSANPENPP